MAALINILLSDAVLNLGALFKRLNTVCYFIVAFSPTLFIVQMKTMHVDKVTPALPSASR